MDVKKKYYYNAKEVQNDYEIKIHQRENLDNTTFDKMIGLFIDNRITTINVKPTTLYNYKNKKNYLKSLLNIKLKDFNINHYDNWKKTINETNLSLRYKNDILKFLKSVMSYATAWHEFNFIKVYPKMTSFKDSTVVEKEMLYFTYDEFKKFISVEENLQHKAMFEILYYCGLRKEELRGLQWKDIDFNKKTISIKRQIIYCCGVIKNFQFSFPKAKNSKRNITI